MRMVLLWVMMLCAPVFGQSVQENHFDMRVVSAGTAAATTGRGVTVITGDSLVEAFWWNSTSCGALINAGSGGATTEMLHDRINNLEARTLPSVIVISIGVNDAHEGFDFEAWRARINGIVYSMWIKRVTMVIETIAPIEQGKPLGDGYFDNNAILQMNAHLRVLANAYRQGAVLNDQHPALADPDGFAPRGMTTDGVHHTGATQREVFRLREAAIKAAWLKRGIRC